ncbi:RluA family pseudouridine synthase [Alphaproteobacteria bacterium LSUCC0684]
MKTRNYIISGDDDGTRLDRFIRRHHAGINQGRIEKLLRNGAIRVDGAKAKSSTRIAEGQTVIMPDQIMVEESRPKAAKSNDPALAREIREAEIGRGEGWIAINKPSGLATQGGAGTHRHVDGVLEDAFPGGERPRLVHRLDRDTSGILLVATTLPASRALAMGFQQHRHQKTYLALVLGVPKIRAGLIDAPLAKLGGPGHEKMAVDEAKGKSARTIYRVLETMGRAASLVAMQPLTGRTHQLRAHMAYLGHPILGDGKYGGSEAFPNEDIRRLCLHAAHLVLESGETVSAPIPGDLAKAFRVFGLGTASALHAAADPSLFEEMR